MLSHNIFPVWLFPFCIDQVGWAVEMIEDHVVRDGWIFASFVAGEEALRWMNLGIWENREVVMGKIFLRHGKRLSLIQDLSSKTFQVPTTK